MTVNVLTIIGVVLVAFGLILLVAQIWKKGFSTQSRSGHLGLEGV